MDGFKFRTWSMGVMGDPFDFEDIHNASSAGIIPSLPFEKYTFMQCTGLKDKHGKLIYEGVMAKIAYEYPPERTYIYCGSREHRVDTEVCAKCPYIKGCSDYRDWVTGRGATKDGGE